MCPRAPGGIQPDGNLEVCYFARSRDKWQPTGRTAVTVRYSSLDEKMNCPQNTGLLHPLRLMQPMPDATPPTREEHRP